MDRLDDQAGAIADRVIERVRDSHGDVLLLSSEHFLRELAASWLGLDAQGGRYHREPQYTGPRAQTGRDRNQASER